MHPAGQLRVPHAAAHPYRPGRRVHVDLGGQGVEREQDAGLARLGDPVEGVPAAQGPDPAAPGDQRAQRVQGVRTVQLLGGVRDVARPVGHGPGHRSSFPEVRDRRGPRRNLSRGPGYASPGRPSARDGPGPARHRSRGRPEDVLFSQVRGSAPRHVGAPAPRTEGRGHTVRSRTSEPGVVRPSRKETRDGQRQPYRAGRGSDGAVPACAARGRFQGGPAPGRGRLRSVRPQRQREGRGQAEVVLHLLLRPRHPARAG